MRDGLSTQVWSYTWETIRSLASRPQPCFTNEESRAQRGAVTGIKVLRQSLLKPGFDTRLFPDAEKVAGHSVVSDSLQALDCSCQAILLFSREEYGWVAIL